MKKLTTFCLASLSLLTLIACSKQEITTAPLSTSSSQTSQTSTSSSLDSTQAAAKATSTNQQTEKKQTGTDASSDQSADNKREETSESETQTERQETAQPLPTNNDLYASTLYLVANDPSRDANLHYAFTDIDGNGTAELVTARIYAGSVYPEAIYYLQHGVPTYLARTYVAGGGGRRENFTIYTDGTVEWDEWSSGSGGGTAYLYQLAEDNSGHWITEQSDFNQRELPNPDYVNQFGGGRSMLDMGSLIWNAF